MTSFLIRLFVRHPEQTEQAETRTAYGKLAGITGLVCNLLLCAAKVVAGILSGSLSMMADAINNLSDSGSAAVTYFGFRLAGKAADAEHPYGHARIEYLTALAISLLILLVGVELAKTSIGRILHPVSTSFSVLSVLILAGSILLKLWMAHFQRTLGRRIDSAALQATADDSRNDVLATGAVLFASVLEVLTGWRADGYFGLLVALFILRNGYEIGKETVNTLLGTAPDPKLVKRIAEEILSHDKVLGIHDLMVHDYGPGRRFASVHAELDSKEPVLACHDLIDEIERTFLQKHDIHLVIHYDPVVTDDAELTRMRGLVAEAVHGIDSRLQIHDFRMVRGPKHTNLIFDLVVPFDLMDRKAELKRRIDERVQFEDSRYYTVITFDEAFATPPPRE